MAGPSGYILRAVNPNTPPEELREIAEEVENPDILAIVASNRSCPLDVLVALPQRGKHRKALVEKAMPWLQWGVAMVLPGGNTIPSPSTPVHILEKLVGDPSPEVRRDLAQNPNLPLHIMDLLRETASEDEERRHPLPF